MIATVSQRTLDEAKTNALEAKRAYLLPRPVVGAGGMSLCWEGRIMRGAELAEQAMQNQQTEQLKRMREGLGMVQADMDAARHEMQNTEIVYMRACEAAGVEPEPLDVGECDCYYCTRAIDRNAIYAAEDRLRAAVFQLTEPGPDFGGLPLPLAYMNLGTEEGKADAWTLFVEFVNAQGNYVEACKKRGQLPQWGYILRRW